MNELSDYDYELPDELIAQQPLPQRADARLLIVDRAADAIDHAHFRDLPEILGPTDHLVLNNTRVIPARLAGRRVSTGGRWQGLFLERDEQDTWKLLCKTRGKLHEGEEIVLIDRTGRDSVMLRLFAKLEQGIWVGRPQTNLQGYQLLDQIGRIPLPHYIRRGESLPSDVEDYQTVFAEHRGSIAAPTAGLHFTDVLLAKLQSRQVGIETLTLHVGLGTFRPIAAEQLRDHVMHAEWCRLESATAQRLREARTHGGRIIAVGTTSVRALETAAKDGSIQPWEGETDIFICPPYEFQATDALITNFHLPRSTLLALVTAFAGKALVHRAYQTAVKEKYRFFSYGDAMLIV